MIFYDAPPLAPSVVKVFSADCRYYVVSDPKLQLTSVFTSATSEMLWQMAGYHHNLFLKNDGLQLVVAQGEGGLLPQDVKPGDTFLSFYYTNKLVRSVQVREVFPKLAVLPKTVSHLAWGQFVGFNKSHRFELLLFNGKHVYFETDN